jgi:hypothetical protein
MLFMNDMMKVEMVRYLLLLLPFKVAAAFSVVFFACGQDPILDAVEEMDAESTTAKSPGGGPGGGENMEPGVPDEPDPGIPTEPSPNGVPGVPGEVVEGGNGAVAPEEPDPGTPEEPEPGTPEEPEPAQPGSAERPQPLGGSAQGEGVVEAPEPGTPEEPEPAPPGSPGGAQHAEKQDFTVEGIQVLVRGQVLLGEKIEGQIRIDLFDGDQRNVAGPRPKVIGVHEMDAEGGFEISVSQSAKRVWLGAYVDLNSNNRPDKGEPSGWYQGNPVQLLDDPIDEVLIRLEVESKSSGLGRDFGE